MADHSAHRDPQFGPFELSSRQRVLRRDGVMLSLGGRALDILIYLAERPGEVIAKQELIGHVWPDVTVEEGNLRVHVAAIRKALGDGQFGNRYIANIKGRGYSFVGTVVPLTGRTKSRNDKLRQQGRLPVRLLMGRALAEEFGGKVYSVDLESLADPHHVAGAVATSLGVALKSKDPGLELVDLVRSRKLLLVILDSCEHAIEVVASPLLYDRHWGPVRRWR